jgi:hypothetical protein
MRRTKAAMRATSERLLSRLAAERASKEAVVKRVEVILAASLLHCRRELDWASSQGAGRPRARGALARGAERARETERLLSAALAHVRGLAAETEEARAGGGAESDGGAEDDEGKRDAEGSDAAWRDAEGSDAAWRDAAWDDAAWAGREARDDAVERDVEEANVERR